MMDLVFWQPATSLLFNDVANGKTGSRGKWNSVDLLQLPADAVRKHYLSIVSWSSRVSTTDFWDELLPISMLSSPGIPLSNEQLDTLWSMFRAIAVHWDLDIEVELLRSRWLDMLEARSTGEPDYRGEYVNAADVYTALVLKLGEPAAIAKVYQDTVVINPAQAATRLGHAKFYVANDFVRCFVVTGGFRGFVPKARNYTGFMGGSRFREWPPVRTAGRK